MDSVELALAEPDPGRASAAGRDGAHSWERSVDEALSVDVAEGLRRARLGEAAALKSDKINSDGVLLLRRRRLVAARGRRSRARARRQRSTCLPAVDDRHDADGKKRNGVHWSALGGQRSRRSDFEAARRTVAKLGARKIPTGAPVVFSPEAGRGLVGQLAGVLRAARLGGAPTWPADGKGRLPPL